MSSDLTSAPASGLSRRTFLRTATAGSALASLGIAGYRTASAAASTSTGFEPTAGSTIPKATIRWGMPPFPDGSFYVVGMKQGWFAEVGLTIMPKPFGADITPTNVVDQLTNGDLDMATMNGPGIVKTMVQVPNLKLMAFTDTYIATYLLAAPQRGLKTASELIAAGMPAAKAIHTAMQQVRGKGVAFNNAGSQRIFLNAIFQTYGGLKYSDVKLTVTSDAQIVQLADGGQIQFATPDGAAQNVQLLHQGWKPLVSVSDLEKLPGSRDIVAASLSHEGPAGMLSYYQQNKETVLRFMSVTFRTIDELVKTPDRFSLLSPYITARAGVPVPTSSLITIFKDINPFVGFDQQAVYWNGGVANPQSYETVYGQQIKAAQQGGLLPKSENLTPADAIIGKEIWQTLLDLKHRYDAIVSKPVKNGALAKQAAVQYARRNYLDAYRFLKAAQG